MVISDVLCVPDLCKTVSLMVMHKMSLLFEDGKVEVHSIEMGDLVALGTEEDGFYRLSTLMFHKDSHSRLWHDRFRSVKHGPLVEAARSQMVDALPLVVFLGGDCQVLEGAADSEEELEEEQIGPVPPA